MAIEQIKTTLTLNPIYAGFAILELSKVLMHDFHYNHIKYTYEDKACLLFTDTDSFRYEIETPNIYYDMVASPHLYEFSNYSETPPAIFRTEQESYREV